MKKFLLVPLTLAFCLAACTPAADSAQPQSEVPVAATAESAPEATPARPAVGNLVMSYHAQEDENGYYNTGVWQDPATGETRWVLFQLDYATGQQRILYDFGPYDGSYMPADQAVVRNGRVYSLGENMLYRFSLDSGQMETLPLAEEFQNMAFVDENAAYQLEGNLYSGVASPQLVRLDLQTGAVTRWDLPAFYLEGVLGCYQDRLLISRCVTDQPLPSNEEWEQLDAVLQNARAEVDWLNLNTGEMEKILSQPFAIGAGESDQVTWWNYEGVTSDALYFVGRQYGADGTDKTATLDRFPLDGSGMETVAELDATGGLYAVFRGDRLAWVLNYDYLSAARLYDVETGQTYENIPLQGVDSGWPILLTGDDRVLVNDHYTTKWAQPVYAILPKADYLAGSRDWTLFTEAQN